MGTFFRRLLAVAMVFQLLQFFPGTAGAYDEEENTNQLRAHEYILQLKSGKEPDTIERPVLKKARTREAKIRRRRMLQAMDQAEDLARAGNSNLIEDPSWILHQSPEKESSQKSSGY